MPPVARAQAPPPTAVQATPGALTISVSWTASNVTLAGGSFVWYNVYREDLTSDQPGTPAFSLVQAGVGVTSYLDTGAQQNRLYIYQVKAQIDDGDEGDPSWPSPVPVSVLTNAAPPSPVALTGTISEQGVGPDYLMWAPTPGATSYNIYGSATPGAAQSLLQGNCGEGWSSTGYGPYAVTALAGAFESDRSPSLPALVKVPDPLPVPAGPVANVSGPTITLSWGAVQGALSYDVFSNGEVLICNVPAPAVGTLSVGASFKGFLGQELRYTVAAVGPGGYGAMSPVVEVSAGAAPPTSPPVLAAIPGNNAVNLTWSPVDGALSYNIYRCAVIAGQEGVMPSYINQGMYNQADCEVNVPDPGNAQDGTPYYYEVKAVSLGGEGPLSNEAGAIPNQTPATAGQVFSMYARSQQRGQQGYVAIGWNAVKGAATYMLYRGVLTNQGVSQPQVLLKVVAPPQGAAGTPPPNTWVDTDVQFSYNYSYRVAPYFPAGQGNMSSCVVSATVGVPPLHSPFAAATVGTPGQVEVDTFPNPLDVFGKATNSDLYGSAPIRKTAAAAYSAATVNIYRGTDPNLVGNGIDVPAFVGVVYNTSGLTRRTEDANNSQLSQGTIYYYRTAVVTVDGEGLLSAPVSVKPGTALLPAPVGLNVVTSPPLPPASASNLALQWGKGHGSAYSDYGDHLQRLR